MIGPIADSGMLFIGGIIGALARNFVPVRLKENLPLILGVITISLGATLTTKVLSFPVVVLSILVGASIGELLYLEKGLTNSIKFIFTKSKKNSSMDESHLLGLITLISAFCFGSMGLFGAVNEGVTGNPDLLLAKAILDLFTAIIFGSVFGGIVAFIAIPQFIILVTFYFSANLIMPIMSDFVLANFTAVGGIIFLATGLRMCNIKVFPLINMVPALFVVFPISLLWLKYGI